MHLVRKASMARLKPDKIQQYVSLHQNAWPEVREEMLRHYHVNHSVYWHGEMLFQYFEYTGEDFDKDMDEMRKNPLMLKWWELCRECVDYYSEEEPVRWIPLEEIFHNG